jgi:hypothetical protein
VYKRYRATGGEYVVPSENPAIRLTQSLPGLVWRFGISRTVFAVEEFTVHLASVLYHNYQITVKCLNYMTRAGVAETGLPKSRFQADNGRFVCTLRECRDLTLVSAQLCQR